MQYGEKWGLDGSWCEKRIDPFNTEYIRSDIVDGMETALEAAIKALEMCGLYLEGNIPEKYEAVINQGFEKAVTCTKMYRMVVPKRRKNE